MSIKNTTKYRKWSYPLSITGGALILFSGIVLSQWHLALSSNLTLMIGPTRLLSPELDLITTALIICGVAVTVSGILVMKWKVTRMLGIIIIVFSAVSLFEMGGFIFGGVMGIIGGFLVLKANTDKREFVESK